MPSFRRRLSLLGSAAGLASAAWLLGCGVHAAQPAVGAERVHPVQAQISDDGFASALHDLLLSEPGSSERAARLRAVEARQMARAAKRFDIHSQQRGVAAVTGALYLAHTGDANPGAFGPSAAVALDAATREFAARGDEGRSRAAYDLLLQVAPDAERADIRAHLQALDEWTRTAVAQGGPIASAGALERVAVRRRLLEPTESAVADAVQATVTWVQRAVSLRDKFRRTRVQPDREEGTEAWRALETGPLVLASIYLRDADAAGAVAALERSQLRELLESERPQFAAALEAAAQDRSIARLIDLLAQLRPLTGRESGRDEGEFDEDRDLFGAAAFGVASECYRLDPTVPQVAFSLVIALDELGMAESAPALVFDAVRAHPDAPVASQALGLSLAAMAREEEAGDPEAARRTFRAAQPLLSLVGQRGLSASLRPSPARVRAAMGEIELREGRIEQARALLQASADEEVAGGVLLALARIEWRDGQTRSALGHLRAALSAEDTQHDSALRGEVLLMISDVTRENGDVAGARTPLAEALKELVQSRNLQDADGLARVERVLARVLDRFGAVQPAQRALERAYEAAPGDKHQAAQTIELLIGRAFVRGEVGPARDGLQLAVAADLDTDDLVYFALWVRLLERQMHLTTDGMPDRVFSSTPDDGRWITTLARFGEGKLKGDELIARAATPIQKYEALFYAAMDRRVSGDTKGGDDLLRQVVAGTGLELAEVTLARDILDPTGAQIGGPLPPDVSIP